MANPETPQENKKGITRRRFLIGLGAGVATLAVGAAVGGPTIVREVRLAMNTAFISGDAPAPSLPDTPFVWFRIDADDTAHLFIPKVEMGQGIHTALAQIAADELELDWGKIQVHQADTSSGFDPQAIFTFGSTSITSMYQPIRDIAATMRTMLETEAAAQLGVLSGDVKAENSMVFVASDAEKSLSYGQIVSNKQGDWQIPEGEPRLKAAGDFKFIGKSVPRVDFYEKVTGRAVYGYDMRLPNMLYGAVARPPRISAKLVRASAGTADGQRGVVKVVIEEGFAGIVAETRSQAYAALEYLELEWEGGTTIGQAELEAIVTVTDGDGTLIQREGDFAGNINADNVTMIEAQYRTPMAAHAHLEAQAALADFMTPESVTIYTSTQAPGITRDAIMERFELEQDKVTVVPTYLGGGFGRKTGLDVAIEAAILSKAVDRPVHVGWNRTEDMRYGYRRQPTHHALRAGIDASGKIVALEHQVASGDVFFLEGLGLPEILGTFLGADPLASYGALVHYNIPNHQVFYHRKKLPVPTAYWRGLGSFPNTFAAESFFDEIAHAAGVDPLTMRLNHLPDTELGKRMRTALEAVADASLWNTPAPDGRGRGLAMTYDRGTVVALVVEISMDGDRPKLHHAWCAIDPGLVINPDGAAAQAQGSIIMGLSSTLYERITVEDGMVVADNFNNYPLITMRDIPDIQVIPISSSDTPVGGMGEPVIGTVPAALSNAIFALTGKRVRELPLL